MEAIVTEKLSVAGRPTSIVPEDAVPELNGIADNPLVEDELYLFETAANERLWGVVDRVYDGEVRLESSTTNMSKFEYGTALPHGYDKCRRATTFESRYYGEMCGLSIGERLADSK